MSPQETVKKLIKEFTGLSGQYSLTTIFNDFCTMAMASLHNSLYTLGKKEIPERYKASVNRIEEEYQKTAQKYDASALDKFTSIFANLVVAMNTTPYDYLGSVYMMLGIGNASAGQFFTPSHICELMARLSADKASIEKQINSGEPITIYDPCCGSGAMAIGFISMLKNDYKMEDYTSRVYMHLVDIDYLCVKIAYIQMAILNIKANIVYGDTLIQEKWDSFDTVPLQIEHRLG